MVLLFVVVWFADGFGCFFAVGILWLWWIRLIVLVWLCFFAMLCGFCLLDSCLVMVMLAILLLFWCCVVIYFCLVVLCGLLFRLT